MILSLHDLSARPRWECDFALNTMNPRYILSELNKLGKYSHIYTLKK